MNSASTRAPKRRPCTSSAVSVAGGLNERKRPFSLLRLTGVRLATLRRVVLTRGASSRKRLEKVRGWRSFMSSPVSNTVVRIHIGDTVTETRTDRSGYVDCRVKGDLTPGWSTARLAAVLRAAELVQDGLDGEF